MEIITITFAVFVALIVALVQVIKGLGMPTKWAPVAAILLGIGLSLIVDDGNISLRLHILQGLIGGLTAMGLFSGAKKITEEIRK